MIENGLKNMSHKSVLQNKSPEPHILSVSVLQKYKKSQYNDEIYVKIVNEMTIFAF